MKKFEYLMKLHPADMMVKMFYDYQLPMNITLGDIIVLEESGHRKESILRHVTVEVEDCYVEVLEAALIILNIS